MAGNQGQGPRPARPVHYRPPVRRRGEALIAPTTCAELEPEILVAKAEVSKLVGSWAEAAASLRTALRIYEDRRAVALADQTRAAWRRTGVTAQPDAAPTRSQPLCNLSRRALGLQQRSRGDPHDPHPPHPPPGRHRGRARRRPAGIHRSIPAAFAEHVPPPGGHGGTVQAPPQAHTTTTTTTIPGGMPGWQITLIAAAAAAAAAAATVAVFLDWASAARRHLTAPTT